MGRRLAAVVTLLGFATGYLIGPAALFVVIVVWLVGFLYNWRFKRSGLPGNLMVSFSVGMTFIYGGIVVGRPWEAIVWFFGVLVLLINLGEEITADAMDVAGDRLLASRSLAIQLGSERALRISAAIFMTVIVISGLPFLFGWLDWIFLPPILLMDGVILYATRKLLDARIANRRKYIRLIYLSGLGMLLIFILISLVR
ncbi:MAG: UbiA family prenyltransferase [Chloroflexota bacterium]